jgi:hypothetical protein
MYSKLLRDIVKGGYPNISTVIGSVLDLTLIPKDRKYFGGFSVHLGIYGVR